MNKRSVGSIYEQLVAEQLINMGYSVLARNYRNRFGEIDIIAKDGDTICFCEVKYRRNNGCGSALEAVGYSKQKKIISVARYYLMTHGLNEWTPCRFDVIAVDEDEVTVLKNAFEGSQKLLAWQLRTGITESLIYKRLTRLFRENRQESGNYKQQ